MYGETHVEPALLFDPEQTAGPPADALDVYFHAPLSLSLLGDALAANAMEHELARLLGFYANLVASVVTQLQRSGGYVAGGHRGRPVPARLEMTALAENAVPGEPTMRLHTHVYVGRTALALESGERHPVDLDRLHRAANNAWRTYLNELVDGSARALGVVWAPLPGHSSGDVEIVDPPLAEHTLGHEFGVCPGEFGARDQVMADAQWRAGMQESARRLAAERARLTG